MMPCRMLTFSLLAAVLGVALLASGCQTGKSPDESQTAPAAGVEPTERPAAAAPAKEPAEAKSAETDAVKAARGLGTASDGAVVAAKSGLQYIDVAQGEGAAAVAGQTVLVHYTGWLVDGTKFDSSVDRGTPFSFPLGAGRVIRGWDEGVAGMKPGGVRKLIIPPDLGYGSRGGGPIPPDSTLIFEVELLQAR